MWCLKAKKTQILIEFLDRTKKVQLAAKKSFLEFRGFCTFFREVDHPLCDVWKQKKTQVLIEFLDWTQKSPASRQKKFPSRQKKLPYGLEDFAPIFGKLTTPSVMFLKQKTQILIAHQKEDIGRTQKSSLVGQKKFPMV